MKTQREINSKGKSRCSWYLNYWSYHFIKGRKCKVLKGSIYRMDRGNLFFCTACCGGTVSRRERRVGVASSGRMEICIPSLSVSFIEYCQESSSRNENDIIIKLEYILSFLRMSFLLIHKIQSNFLMLPKFQYVLIFNEYLLKHYKSFPYAFVVEFKMKSQTF